jgi:hypothetical protein
MKRAAVAGLLLLAVCAVDSMAAGLSRQVVAYDLKARLRPETRTVEGRETLTWINDSAVPARELRFHLYLNAFRSNRTTFMVERGALAAPSKRPSEEWGSIEIRSLRVPGGPDLAPALEFIQPDDGNREDRTVARRPSCPR